MSPAYNKGKSGKRGSPVVSRENTLGLSQLVWNLAPMRDRLILSYFCNSCWSCAKTLSRDLMNTFLLRGDAVHLCLRNIASKHTSVRFSSSFCATVYFSMLAQLQTQFPSAWHWIILISVPCEKLCDIAFPLLIGMAVEALIANDTSMAVFMILMRMWWWMPNLCTMHCYLSSRIKMTSERR